jgi:hypothetical protein
VPLAWQMHGGKSPGAPKGKSNGNYRHGRFTCEAIERRRDLNGVYLSISAVRPLTRGPARARGRAGGRVRRARAGARATLFR